MKRRTKFILLAVYYIASVLIGVLIALTSTPICLHEQCVQKSAFLLSKMDQTVDPCKDFYKFMCGAAREVPPKPYFNVPGKNASSDPRQSESVFRYMVRKVSLYSGATRAGTFKSYHMLFHEKLLAQFFTMCNRVVKTGDQATTEEVRVKLQLAVYGTGMSVRDLFNQKHFLKSLTVGKFELRLKEVGFAGRHLFEAQIRRDRQDRDYLTLYVSRAVTFLSIQPSDVLSKKPIEWIDTVRPLIQHFAPSCADADFDTDVLLGALEIWISMATIAFTKEDGKAADEAVPMAEIQKRFPDLDFKGFLESMGAKPINVRYIYLMGNSRNYFIELQKLMSKHTRQQKVVYQVLQCVWDVVPFLQLTSFLNSMLSGIGSLSSQNDLCKNFLGKKFVGMVLSLVIERFQLERNPPDILENVFPTFQGVMSSWMNKASWMDAKTRIAGNEKLSAMQKRISLSKKQFDSVKTPGKRSKFYNGLCVQRSVLQTLLCLNAFFSKKNYGLFHRELTGFDEADQIEMGDITYDQTSNMFNVPIFILRFPAFDSAWPLHVNFGGIGVEIAAALTDGFDYFGSQRDKFGLVNSWWTNETLDNYKKREVECSTLMRPVVERRPRKTNYTVRDHKTLTDRDLEHGELSKSYWRNIEGIRMAIISYKAYRSKLSYRGRFLPGLEQFSESQNYFLAHAHMRCLPPNPSFDLKTNQTIYFQAIVNLKEFKDAFHCYGTKPSASRKVAAVGKATQKCMIF